MIAKVAKVIAAVARGRPLALVILFALLPAGHLMASESGTSTNYSVAIKDIHGKTVHPLGDGGQIATVLFFVLSDCPLANTCAPEINRLAGEFQPKGIRSFVVHVEEDLSERAARQHAKAYGYTCPVLLDRKQQLARFAGVTVSPEVAVFSRDHQLLYRGRIDDRLQAFGKQRPQPTKRDLREALEAILAGKPVPSPITKAIGCYLPLADQGKP